jgi:DNA-binding SARP family transcriptional activator
VLRVYATGSPTLVTADSVVSCDDLGAPQSVALFVLLAAEHRRPLSVDVIIEHVWPDGSTSQTRPALRALLSKLRRRLPGDVEIRYALGCYQLLLPAQATVDLDVCAAAVERAEHAVRRGEPRRAAGDAIVAASIAGQGILPAWSSWWAEDQRRRLVEVRVRAQECLATFFLATGDSAQAVRVLRDVVKAEPFRETAHRQLMRAHAEAGNRAEVAVIYDLFRARLERELGIDPAHETTALREQLVERGGVVTRKP